MKNNIPKTPKGYPKYLTVPKKDSIVSIYIENAFGIVGGVTLDLTQSKLPNLVGTNTEPNDIINDVIIKEDGINANLITGIIGQNGVGKSSLLKAIQTMSFVFNYRSIMALFFETLLSNFSNLSSDKTDSDSLFNLFKNNLASKIAEFKGNSKENSVIRVKTTSGVTFEAQYFNNDVLITRKVHKSIMEFNLSSDIYELYRNLNIDDLMNNRKNNAVLKYFGDTKFMYLNLNIYTASSLDLDLNMAYHRLYKNLGSDATLELINLIDPAISFIGTNKNLALIARVNGNEGLAESFLPDGVKKTLIHIASFISFAPYVEEREFINMVLIDELELHLQPSLISFILKLYRDETINKTRTQLIFTTHYREIFSDEVSNNNIILLEKKGSHALMKDENGTFQGVDISFDTYNFHSAIADHVANKAKESKLSDSSMTIDLGKKYFYMTSARKITEIDGLKKQEERDRYFKGHHSYNEFLDEKLGIQSLSFDYAKQVKALRIIRDAITKN